uniref:TIL domain-containing protein n=1 Tax=Angiostrongylus cantonensis TaxID=6313 RepID=A0A0K0DJK4_ANGCA
MTVIYYCLAMKPYSSKFSNFYFITARLNQCDENEVFDACGSPCEPSCWDPFPQTCTFQCVIGCRCRNGFLRDYEGRCVRNCGREFKPLSAILGCLDRRY